MPTEHEWHVVVQDDAGKPVTDARVVLVQESVRTGKDFPYPTIPATHAHATGGKYEPVAPIIAMEGDWLLIVTRNAKSPVIQPLTLQQRNEEWVVSPRSGLVATLRLAIDVAKVKDRTVRRASFTAVLYPSSELVFVAGVDYFSKGVVHRQFAESRMRILRMAKTIDNGAMQSLFACDERAQVFLALPASGPKLIEIARKQLGPRTIAEGNSEDIRPGMNHLTDPAKDVSVVHCYKYLAHVGQTEPKRVKEAGLFSHSWKGGPILYNTKESAAYPASDARDPNDLDARSKDYRAVNTEGWGDMKQAFANRATFRIWGCSATRHTRRKMIEMNRRRHKDGTFFTVHTDEEGHGGGPPVLWTDERLTPELLRWQLDQELRNESYMGAAARWLGAAATVYGAPPGAGSDLWSNGGVQWMMINTTTYAENYTYLKRELAPEFETTSGAHDGGYVNYSKLLGRPAAAKPAFSTQYYRFTRYRAGNWAMLELPYLGKILPANMSTYNVKLLIAEDPNAFSPKNGTLYTLEDLDDAARSKAYFHQDDESVWEVMRDATNKFTVLGDNVLRARAPRSTLIEI